jgi:hypothetical protein
VAPGQSKTVAITISSSSSDGVQRFGRIDLVANGRTPLHLPVAFVPTQGTLGAVSSCDDTTLDFGATTGCSVTVQNDSFADTTVDVHATVDDRLQITDAGGEPIFDGTSTQALGVELAGREPGVPALDPQDGFDGYLELAGDVVSSPDPIGDEEFLQYTGFGSFVFNGQTYDEVNVNSNGYLVAGPATSEDDVCCPPQGTPDASPPNNVIAPFWSDLAGDTGTPAGEPDLGVYVAILSDGGGNSWLVLESRLTDCCDGDADHGSTKVSQVWLGLNGTQDITIDYPTDARPDTSGIEQAPGDPLAVVAVQNEQGEGDSFDPEADPPPSDFFVLSSDPVPGDSYTMSLEVQGVQPGGGVLHAEATSPDVHGTTVVETALTVGQPPATGVDAFITRAFQDFLGRNPSSGELSTIRSKLNDGSLSRRGVIFQLATSNEYLGREVDERYAQLLGRDPDPNGRAYWIGKLRSGLSETGLVSSLVGSNEFYRRSGETPGGFADRAYQVLLDRQPTTGERNAVIAALAGGQARSSAGKAIYLSEESRRRRVAALYLRLLHRGTDPSGETYWANVIKTKGDIALAVYLATSNEYYHRTR